MNTNCLEGYRCPRCHQEDKILILVKTWVAMTDNGHDPFDDAVRHLGDTDWGLGSTGVCPECKFSGKMYDFLIQEAKGTHETKNRAN